MAAQQSGCVKIHFKRHLRNILFFLLLVVIILKLWTSHKRENVAPLQTRGEKEGNAAISVSTSSIQKSQSRQHLIMSNRNTTALPIGDISNEQYLTTAAERQSNGKITNESFYDIKRLNLSCPPDINKEILIKLQTRNLVIPKIIHQSWKTKDLPKRFAKWQKSWRVCFPDWEYKLWSDKDNRMFIKTHYPWFLKTYDAYDANIKRADVVRYFYLYHYGGMYVDLDYECIRPFEHLLVKDLIFESMDLRFDGHKYPDYPYIQNSFIISRAGHPFWKQLLAGLPKNSTSGRPEFVTGPQVVMDALKNYTKYHDDYVVFPPCYFNPFNWGGAKTHCKDFNQMTDSELQRCKELYPNAYTITYHAQSWGIGSKNVW